MGEPVTLHYWPAPSALIGFSAFARRLKISPSTLERTLRVNPAFPWPTRVGRDRFFYESDVAPARAALAARYGSALTDA